MSSTMLRRSRSVPPGFLGRALVTRRLSESFKSFNSDTLSEVSSTAESASLALSASLKAHHFHKRPCQDFQVVGQRCVLFNRPRRANIRHVAVSQTGLRGQRAFSAGRLSSGRSSSRANRSLMCGLEENEVFDLLYRDITPEDYDMLLRLDEMVPKRTATADTLAHLRLRIHGERLHEVCGVCLAPFDPSDDVLAVSCPAKHEFHRQCISKWLTECNKTCPVDHAELPELLTAR